MASKHTEDRPVRVVIEERGNIRILRFIGRFTGSSYKDVVEPLMIERYRLPGRRWRVLSDFSEARVGDAKAILGHAELARANRPFEERAAVIGLNNSAMRFIADRVLTLSSRQGVRVFEHETDALAWLAQDDPNSSAPT